jgi:hypothetical protein
VKLQAIHNLHEAGVDIVPVTTIINGINNEQVGRIIEFALDNPKKINFLSFQPVSFTGRDEDISDERRMAQRYTLSTWRTTSRTRPASASPPRLVPHQLHEHLLRLGRPGPRTGRDWGQLSCGCHPNCGIGMALMIDKETKEAVPVTAFLNADRWPRTSPRSTTRPAASSSTVVGVTLALLRNYDPKKAPTHFKITRLLQKFDKTFGATGKQLRQGHRRPHHGRHREAPRRPLELPLHRRHVVPGSVQLRLPPHRAVHHPLRHAGRRDQLLRVQHGRGLAQHHREDAHDATLTKWYEEHGRHEIFAGGKKVGMEQGGYELNSTWSTSTPKPTTPSTSLGIAKNSREEKIRAGAAGFHRRSSRWERQADLRKSKHSDI